MVAAPAVHYLLSASSIWTHDLRVLGVFETEEAALEHAAAERFLADLTGPVCFRVEQWEGPRLVRTLTSSPPHEVDGDLRRGWV